METQALKQFAANLEAVILGMTFTGAVDQLGMDMALVFLRGIQKLKYPPHGAEAKFDPRDRKTFRPLLRWFFTACESLGGLDDATKFVFPGDVDFVVVNLLKENGIEVTLTNSSPFRMMGLTKIEDLKKSLELIWSQRAKISSWRRFEQLLIANGVCNKAEFDLARDIHPRF